MGRRVSISHLRFFSLIFDGHDGKGDPLLRFNLTLEILFTDLAAVSKPVTARVCNTAFCQTTIFQLLIALKKAIFENVHRRNPHYYFIRGDPVGPPEFC